MLMNEKNLRRHPVARSSGASKDGSIRNRSIIVVRVSVIIPDFPSKAEP